MVADIMTPALSLSAAPVIDLLHVVASGVDSSKLQLALTMESIKPTPGIRDTALTRMVEFFHCRLIR